MAESRGLTAGWLSLVFMVLLGACTTGGPVSGLPGAASVVPEQTMRASDGSAVAVSQWGPEDPQAVILALHGFGDYGESSFSWAAPYWTDKGIMTLAVDQRGFGRNISRGQWPGADGLIADAVAFSAQIRDRFPCKPLVVLGHSMGGGVVLAAADKGLQGDAILLAVPAIWGGEKMNPIHRFLSWWVTVFVPDMRLSGGGLVRIQATDNIEVLRALQNDPLYLSPPSAREILGLMRITDRAAEVAEHVETPALMLLGSKDQIVPNDAVREVFERLNGPKKVIEYPDGWHQIFRDLQAENVWRDTAEWVLSQKPPAACPEAQN